MMQKKIITFIGAGHITSSVIGGLIADGYDAKCIWAADPHLDKLTNLQSKFSINITQDNYAAVKISDVIVFAVKPQKIKMAVTQLASELTKKQPLIISLAAGVRINSIQEWLTNDCAIVRCMPNTPALIRCGATALYANDQVTPEQKNLAESILRAVGLTVWLNDENQLDVVTALSGSGPAYFFRMMEALEQAAQGLGLSADIAHLLTVQTALGAARMAIESNQPLAQLRQQVASPGGTTERALQILDQRELDKLFADVLAWAAARSRELGEMFGK